MSVSVSSSRANRPRARSLLSRDLAPASALVPQAGQVRELPDEQLRDLVQRRIDVVAPRSAPLIRVAVDAGVVTLKGRVASDYEQFTLQQQVRKLAYVRDVVDQLAPVAILDDRRPLAGPTIRDVKARQGYGFFGASLLLLLAALGGWQWVHSYSGLPLKITFAGKPAAGLLVTLHPLLARTPSLPEGEVLKNGTVRWTKKALSHGIAPGEYVVTTRWNASLSRRGDSPFGPWDLPSESLHPETSRFRLSIPPKQSGPVRLELSPSAAFPSSSPRQQEPSS